MTAKHQYRTCIAFKGDFGVNMDMDALFLFSFAAKDGCSIIPGKPNLEWGLN